MDASELLIVVPARGGSKGLPRKNAKLLGDRPLLGWTAEAIKQSGLKKAHCILSTDDKEIAAIGESVGLDVPFLRPPELASDEANSVDVSLHALDWLKNERGIDAKYFMLLQPTSPFRPPHIINTALDMLKEDGTDAVVAVKPIHRSLGTLFVDDGQGFLEPLQQQTEVITRRQDVRSLFTPNGALYAIRSDVLRKHRTAFPARCQSIVLDQIASLDIDDPIDWKIAEAIVQAGSSWLNSDSLMPTGSD